MSMCHNFEVSLFVPLCTDGGAHMEVFNDRKVVQRAGLSREARLLMLASAACAIFLNCCRFCDLDGQTD